MTVTEVRTCMYCMRPALHQHTLFQDDGAQVLTGNAMCHAHDFLHRYRESPSYQNPDQHTYTFACPACEYDEADLNLRYTFVTNDGSRIGTHTHSALDGNTTWDTSELQGGYLTIGQDWCADFAADRLIEGIRYDADLRAAIGVTDLEDSSLSEINNDPRVNELITTIEITDLSASCNNCGNAYDTELI